ncbi:MAG: hypothetical protein AB7E80_05850 [Hyphomicrobiaceae bacterium]
MSTAAEAPRVSVSGTTGRRDEAAHSAATRLAGLTLMAGLPALFWTGLIGVGFSVAGSPLSAATLGKISLGLAAFLVVVCAAVTSRPD